MSNTLPSWMSRLGGVLDRTIAMQGEVEAQRAAYLDRLERNLPAARAAVKAEAADIIAQVRARRSITRDTLVRITDDAATRCATLADCFPDDLDGLSAAIADLICRRLHCVGGGAAPLFIITLAE